MIPAILDVIPDAVDDFEQLVADFLRVGHRVPNRAAHLDPPIARRDFLVVPHQVVVGERIRPRGLDKGNGPPRVPRLEQDGIAHGDPVGLFHRPRLAVFRRRLPPHMVVGPGHGGQSAVSRAVDKNRGAQPEHLLGGHLPGLHRFDAGPGRLVVHADAKHRGVEVHIQPRLQRRFLPHHGVQHGKGIGGIARLVLQQDFFQNTGFARIRPIPVAGRADDMHAHLGAGVAPQNRPLVHQRRAGARPRGRYGGAYPRDAPADDHHVILFFHHKNSPAFRLVCLDEGAGTAGLLTR